MPAVLHVQRFREPLRHRGRDVYARLYVGKLVVDEIHVPTDMRGPLRASRLAQEAVAAQVATPKPPDRYRPPPPRYAVRLAFGRRYEPWVLGVRPLR